MNRKPFAALLISATMALTLVGGATAQNPEPLQAPPAPEPPQMATESAALPDIVEQPASANATPLGTGIAYVGQLKKKSDGKFINGACAFRLSLWDAATGGTQIGSEQTVNGVNVVNGLFKIEVDFGNAYTGDRRWLQTGVKCGNETVFTTFDSRQELNAVPYAMGLRPGAWIKSSNSAIPVSGESVSGVGLYGKSNDSTAVLGHSINKTGVGGVGGSTGVFGRSVNGIGVSGESTNGTGVSGESTNGTGVSGKSTNGTGVAGETASPRGKGVQGYATNGGSGVYGFSTTGAGVAGETTSGTGVYGASADAVGVWGRSVNHYGVYGFSDHSYAGYFDGKVRSRVLEISGGSDLAEGFQAADAELIEPGTVVVVDSTNAGKVKASQLPYDTAVVGIVSGAGGLNTGLTLQQEGLMDGNTPVAVAGRVYCKAEAISAPIKPGDLLTTSAIPGRCMKAANRDQAYGAVIGKALTGLDEGYGLVLVLVNLQ